MQTRKHIHAIDLPASSERVFAILHTPSAIRAWWCADRAIVIAKPGGVWMAAWGAEDDPDYISSAAIAVFDPPRRLVLANTKYHAQQGPPPFDAKFTIEFTVERLPTGSRLRVVQDGFPADAIADEFYAACEVGWKNTFENIRAFLARTG